MASTPLTPRKRGPAKSAEKKVIEKIVKDAKSSGLMPHDILLKAARGEMFNIKTLVIVKHKSGPNKGEEKERRWLETEYYPSYSEQIEAARSAAPYFMPKLATQVIKTDDATADALTQVMKELAGKLPG